MPAPSWSDRLPAIVDSRISIVPIASLCAWLPIAPAPSSKAPGLSETTLRSTSTVPAAALLSAAPPSFAPFPDTVEPISSTRPLAGVVDAAAELARVAAEHRDVFEPEDAGGRIVDTPAGLGAVAALDRQPGDRNVARGSVDLEQAVETRGVGGRSSRRLAAVEDRPRGAGADDLDRPRDVPVAVVREIVVLRPERERIGAGRQHDLLPIGQRVRLLDRRAQRAVRGGSRADAVSETRVDSVPCAVNREREAVGCEASLQAEDTGERERHTGGRDSPASLANCVSACHTHPVSPSRSLERG